MADGLELKRIVDLVAQTDVDDGVYTIIDSVSGAVKKYPVGSFICSIAPIFSTSVSYTAGKYCNYNGQLYQFDEDHAAGGWIGTDATAVTLSDILSEIGEDVSDLQGDVSTLQTDVAGKADADGNYPNMTVGNAEQLVSSIKINDHVPYQFRTSGGSVDIGYRETDMIVGGSLVWNQLAIIAGISWSVGYNGITITKVDNATIKVSGTATSNANARAFYTGVNFPANHVYLLSIFDNRIQVRIGNGLDVVGGGLCKPSTSTESTVIFYIANGTDFGNGVELKPQIFDLTQMFGSTIADYIYSLGTALSESGVAWFRKLFPKDYYAYNAGEILSVSGVSAHVMTGFNQWDEEWEVYGSSGQIKSKNKIPVIAGATYYLKSPKGCTFYKFTDLTSSNIGYITVSANSTFTVPGDTNYLSMYTDVNYGTTYNHDICINLHWDGERDGEYEPYVKHSYPLDDSLTLRGIPKLDANNNLYYDGDTYESDGTVTRRFVELNFGTDIDSKPIGWFTADANKDTWGFYWNYNSAAFNYQIKPGQILSDKFIKTSGVYALDTPYVMSATYTVEPVGYIAFRIPKSAIAAPTDGNELESLIQTWVANNPFKVVAELATPTTESADAYQNPQIVNDWGTEEYVTTSIVPVGHNTEYSPNLRAKLEMAPNSPDGDGDYIVRQTDGENEYVELVIPSELPEVPTTDGNYKLRVSVSSGTATYSWVADS